MLSREGKQTDRGAVGAEFIGYNRRRREALLLQEFPHQPNCRPSVPAGLNQEIQDFALTVHGTPEIELPPSNYDDHLVQVPAFGRSWPPTLNPPRIGPTEFQDPSSNCLIRDVETTLGKQVLNVPIAQRETAIEPDGMLDDDRWKAVTTVGYLAHPETLKHRPCRSHAVNVTMPNRTLGVLSKMFNLAELWGLRPDGSNPCLHVKRYKEEKRERFLNAEEFTRLGRVLDEILEDGSETRSAVAAIRLLMLTGCRLSEIQKLRWEHVDLDAGELRLPDTKTGWRAVPLAPSAVRLLTSLPRDEDNPWVIVGRKPGWHLTDLQHPWRRIRARAGLDGVRIYDLRHSFASRALALGEGLPMIGKLLGHTQVQTTARYAHLARDNVKASAARIGDSIDRDLDATE